MTNTLCNLYFRPW